MCEKNLRHYARVLRLLERYEREGAALLTEEQRAASREIARTLRTFVSTLRVEVADRAWGPRCTSTVRPCA